MNYRKRNYQVEAYFGEGAFKTTYVGEIDDGYDPRAHDRFIPCEGVFHPGKNDVQLGTVRDVGRIFVDRDGSFYLDFEEEGEVKAVKLAPFENKAAVKLTSFENKRTSPGKVKETLTPEDVLQMLNAAAAAGAVNRYSVKADIGSVKIGDSNLSFFVQNGSGDGEHFLYYSDKFIPEVSRTFYQSSSFTVHKKASVYSHDCGDDVLFILDAGEYFSYAYEGTVVISKWDDKNES